MGFRRQWTPSVNQGVLSETLQKKQKLIYYFLFLSIFLLNSCNIIIELIIKKLKIIYILCYINLIMVQVYQLTGNIPSNKKRTVGLPLALLRQLNNATLLRSLIRYNIQHGGMTSPLLKQKLIYYFLFFSNFFIKLL